MEFRYRAGEKTEQPRLPLVASFSPPPLQPPEAAVVHSRPSLGELQRELLEERIKEEILVRRLNQRRMIEEQLRRELAIGRPLPFHGPVPALLQPQPLMALPPAPMLRYAVPPPPPLVREAIDFDSRSLVVPLQAEEEDESPMVRVKKRKAPEADNAAGGGEMKLPRRKEWGCALCMVSATNEEGLKDHLKGKKHQAKAAAELASGSRKKEGGRSHWVAARSNHLFCEACGVKCYSKEVMISHLSGKKHQQQQQ